MVRAMIEDQYSLPADITHSAADVLALVLG